MLEVCDGVSFDQSWEPYALVHASKSSRVDDTSCHLLPGSKIVIDPHAPSLGLARSVEINRLQYLLERGVLEPVACPECLEIECVCDEIADVELDSDRSM